VFFSWPSQGKLAAYLADEATIEASFEPYTVAPGIDTIAVPDFNLDVLGHGYFAQAHAVLGDLRTLMLHDTAPEQRIRLERASDGGQHFWRMRR
jgi:hypothetical protein